MRMPSPALLSLPQSHRRNRLILAGLLPAALLTTGVATLSLLKQAQPGPLLLALDESPIDSHKPQAVAMIAEPTVGNLAIGRFGALAMGRPDSTGAQVGGASRHEIAKSTDDQIATSSDLQPAATPDVPMFNGRPVRPARTMQMLVTAYSPDVRSCGASADGITASGYSVWTNGMKLAAADTSVLPFGALISVPGYDGGAIIPVLDRGGAIKGHRLDLLYPTHEQALQWGSQRLEVTVWEYADGQPNDFRRVRNSAGSLAAR